LRGHTQHARAGQSVLRGPHLATRKESHEGVGMDHHHRSESSGFGSGL
jgi:stage V sporulation protein G